MLTRWFSQGAYIMRRFTVFSLVLATIGLTFLSGCGGEFARRSDGTCVLACGGGN